MVERVKDGDRQTEGERYRDRERDIQIVKRTVSQRDSYTHTQT